MKLLKLKHIIFIFYFYNLHRKILKKTQTHKMNFFKVNFIVVVVILLYILNFKTFPDATFCGGSRPVVFFID